MLGEPKDLIPAMDLAQQAVNAALSGNWDSALEFNSKILKNDPKNIDALNRLARAQAELGKFNTARKTAKKVISLDPFNTIAQKSLDKWSRLKKPSHTNPGASSSNMFLEEPGKTKVVSLMHLGGEETIAEVDSGDKVRLNTNSHRVTVFTLDGKYIGRLADDLSARIKKLTKLGNEYEACVKTSKSKDVKIFIREIKRTKKLMDVPSFSGEKIDYIAFTSPDLVHKRAI